MGFLAQWFWHLLAFMGGSGVAWVITVLTIHRTGQAQALADLPAGSRVVGPR